MKINIEDLYDDKIIDIKRNRNISRKYYERKYNCYEISSR